MNALVNAENTVSALNIVPQVKEGCSNDGQLLTNTGLLPLDKGVSSMLFGDRNIYPSLPRILARKNLRSFSETTAPHGIRRAHTKVMDLKRFSISMITKKRQKKRGAMPP